MDRAIIIILICETGSHHRKLLPRTIFGRKSQICPFLACLTLTTQCMWSIAPTMHYLREQAMCLLQNTMRTTTARSRKTTKPQYSNRVHSACLTLLTLSGPWPAWLCWLSARSQLGSQAIKWGHPLFRDYLLQRNVARQCQQKLVFILQRIHNMRTLFSRIHPKKPSQPLF